MSDLVNKVSQKPIVQIDLESWLPSQSEISTFDIKDFLIQEWMLKEVEFREEMDTFDWTQYSSKSVIIICSNDAIVPQWAFLIVSYQLFQVNAVAFDSISSLYEQKLLHRIETLDIDLYKNQRVLVKGCNNEKIGIQPYMALTQKLSSVVKSFSFGESCSMVPIFK